MRSRSCSSASSSGSGSGDLGRVCVPRAGRPAGGGLAAALLALAGLLAGAGAAPAATVLAREVVVDIRADGTLSERTHLEVRLDESEDLGEWSPYPIYLDLNRTLESLTASVRRPDGQVVKVARRALDTVEVAGDSILHSSRKFRTVTFPGASLGSVLLLDYEVAERPYFPSGWIALGQGDPTERLRVEVRGGGAGWRWRIDESGGARAGLAVADSPGGVVVTASGLPRLDPPDLAPQAAHRGPVLRYAWGADGGWQGVGRWYGDLLGQVGRGAEPVRAKALAIAEKIPGRRERIAALLAFVRRDVRYVAVEVGIGGYRPGAPAEVLSRRWGDCKDKALLLVDLLGQVGIEAYPALVLAADADRVDGDFPSPDQFNHVIAVVPAEGLALPPDAPVAGGFLFLDATQEEGGLDWLQPAVQDQDALIVRREGPVLVRTPVRPGLESEVVEVDAEVTPAGEVVGEARLRVTGEQGVALARLFETSRPERKEEALRHIFNSLLPGVTLTELRWGAKKDAVPAVTLAAKVRIPELLPSAGEGGEGPVGGSFQLPGYEGTPAPSVLDERKLPVVVTPFANRFIWRLKLPARACPAADPEQKVENDLGSFRQVVQVADRQLTVERQTALSRRWIEPAAFPALKELSLAERRALKRRIRLQCGE